MSVYSVPKPRRVKDKKLLLSYAKDYCELCGGPYGLQRHHIKTKGARGGDEHDNIIMLCVYCHRSVHDGHIPRETLRGVKDGTP